MKYYLYIFFLFYFFKGVSRCILLVNFVVPPFALCNSIIDLKSKFNFIIRLFGFLLSLFKIVPTSVFLFHYVPKTCFTISCFQCQSAIMILLFIHAVALMDLSCGLFMLSLLFSLIFLDYCRAS
jgi:hypothetical protein